MCDLTNPQLRLHCRSDGRAAVSVRNPYALLMGRITAWKFVRVEFSWRAGFPFGYYMNRERNRLWVAFGIPFLPMYWKRVP